ncbi:ABC transporter [Streptomyces sp. NRRL WC-3618]|uniref:ABC transporter permease n=1 Tax=Streptomyces sp. NRRL WC-3618 TaxID=1519490 RepID=UPI0006AEBB71|nr:ABC transporter permease [Streptomyces sp. NRRL WC-3618]KOV63869.1 ABC transporter [Streptomyces sp. NRRL WC-3618]
MTATTATEAPAAEVAAAPAKSQLHTFGAILWRDVFVALRQFPTFIGQAIIQPFFTLFVFGVLLSDAGYVDGDYSAVLLPGVLALNGFLGGMQNTALPLVVDFSYTREIEDRLLSPISLRLVAVEKILFGALYGFVASLMMTPVGMILLDLSWPISKTVPALGIAGLGALAGASIGMCLGTSVSSDKVDVMFTLVLMPLLFTGSTQFPLVALDEVRWFQVICGANPLSYASEGMRAVTSPNVEHVPLPITLIVLVGSICLFAAVGIRGFLRRAQA